MSKRVVLTEEATKDFTRQMGRLIDYLEQGIENLNDREATEARAVADGLLVTLWDVSDLLGVEHAIPAFTEFAVDNVRHGKVYINGILVEDYDAVQ